MLDMGAGGIKSTTIHLARIKDEMSLLWNIIYIYMWSSGLGRWA